MLSMWLKRTQKIWMYWVILFIIALKEEIDLIVIWKEVVLEDVDKVHNQIE